MTEYVPEQVIGRSATEDVSDACLCVPKFFRDKFQLIASESACLTQVRVR